MYFFHECVWIWNLNWSESEFAWIWFLKKKTEEKVLSKKSLKKNHYQIISEQIPYPRISKETFPAKRLERGISTQKMSEDILSKTSLTTCIYPKTIWREMYTKKFNRDLFQEKNWTRHNYHKLSEKNSLQSNFRKKPPQKTKNPPKVPDEKSLPKNRKVKFYQNISEENFSTKQSVKGNSLPNKLWIEISSKQIPKELLPKNIWGNMPTKHILKTNLYETCLKKNLSLENLWNHISTKYYPNRNFYQTNLKKHSRTKPFGEKSPPKSLSRDIFLAKNLQKINQKIFEETFSTKKNERNYVPQKPVKTLENKSLPFFGEKPPPNKLQKKLLPKNLWTMSAEKIWRQIST